MPRINTQVFFYQAVLPLIIHSFIPHSYRNALVALLESRHADIDIGINVNGPIKHRLDIRPSIVVVQQI